MSAHDQWVLAVYEAYWERRPYTQLGYTSRGRLGAVAWFWKPEGEL